MAFRTSSAEDRFGFREVGSVKFKYRLEIPIMIAMTAVLVIGIAAAIISMNAVEIMESGETYYRLIAFGFNMGIFDVVMFLVVVWAVICAVILIILLTGKQKRFVADESCFTLSLSENTQDKFFYGDVEEIRFSTLRLLFIERGFRVVIRTKYRTYAYDTIYSKNKVHRTPEGSPFFIIVQRAGLVKHSWDDYSATWRRTEKEV